ncbi:hypothetical protein BLA29_007285, partial [Euroglyphus maynei]
MYRGKKIFHDDGDDENTRSLAQVISFYQAFRVF